jgi:hypothetical protein
MLYKMLDYPLTAGFYHAASFTYWFRLQNLERKICHLRL